MKRKYTIFTWELAADGSFVNIVFPEATMETVGGEYIIHDLTAVDTHFGVPMSTVRRIKEEPVDA